MGADLLLNFAEIDKDKEPDWTAAMNWVDNLANLPDERGERLASILGNICLGDPDYLFEDAIDKCKAAINSAKEGWDGGLRLMTVVETKHSKLLIAADSSWGDPVDEVDDLCWFIECGRQQKPASM